MINITYYGHACFMVDLCGTTILFDPFITENDAAKDKINISDINPDYILLSHGHFDHISDVEAIAKQSGAPIIANFEIANHYGEKDFDARPLNQGGNMKLDGEIEIKAVNAIHTSSFPDGSYAGQPMGFVVCQEGVAFYYSGDTALTYDMKLISDQFQLDFAFLCIGDNFTMGIDDAIRAADFVGVHQVIGMHFDTFEPIEINHEVAKTKFKAAGKNLKLAKIGETFSAECAINRDQIKKNYG